jgi:UDPglucose 6-dehydrogenase
MSMGNEVRRLRYEAEVMAATHTARREALTLAARLARECGRLRSLAGHLGTPAGSGADPVAAIEADIQALREEVEREGWPLPDVSDLSSSLPRPDAPPAGNGQVPAAAALDWPRADQPSVVPVPALAATPENPPAPLHITVLGAGHVGLVTAACLAQLGHSVVCTDHVTDRVEGLVRGICPFTEPGLDALLREDLAARRLSFSADNGAAVADADVVLICLPTPESADGHADMTALEDAAREIGPHLRAGAIVAQKSTVPVGSCRNVAAWLGRCDVAVVSNPEFLREGSALADFFHPDRVVIGADDPWAAETVAGLYRRLGTQIMTMSPESAELVKYASNGMLATRLSYINDIATICELVQADVTDVIRGMGGDRRIGQFYLEPGPGWGGSCFHKDADALVEIAGDAGLDFALLRTVVESNRAHQARVADRIEEIAGGSVKGRNVAVWGLTFKTGTNDRSRSPSLAIAARLRDRGATIQAYDPTVHGPVSGIKVCPSPLAACEDASVLFVATGWDELSQVDLGELRQVMDRPAILDGRRLLDPVAANNHGFTYAAVGQPISRHPGGAAQATVT